LVSLSAGEAAARVLGVASFVVLARALPIADFGTFSFAMSTALVTGVLIDMGQNTHLGRVVARNPERASVPLSQVLLNKAVLGGLAVVAVSIVLLLVGFEGNAVLLVALMGTWAMLLSMFESVRAVARAMNLMPLDGAANGLESVGRLTAVLVAWGFNASVTGYAAAYIVEAALALAMFAFALARRSSLRVGRIDASGSVGFLRDSWALGLMAVAVAGFYRVDQVVVQGLAGAAANGLYGAAARVAFTATVGGSLVVMATYPELSRTAAAPRVYGTTLRRTLALSIAVALAAGTVVFAAADSIVSVLFGPSFAGAAPILRILSLVVVGNGVTLVGMYSASALGRERRAVLLAAIMIGLNLGANLLLVPRFGAVGAAWVSSAGEVTMAAGMLLISADFLFGRRDQKGVVREC
jgi:O-antigen/teichoic acid export membrane protein